MNWRTALLSLASTCALVLAAQSAQAQSYELLVVTGDNVGLSATEHEDIAEESAWLAQDFGGFNVTRWYQLDGLVPYQTATAVRACGSDVSCHVDQLFDSRFDYVLVVNTYIESAEIVVRYQMIDAQVGILAKESNAFLPTATEFAYLVVPCHDALKVTPAWVEPVPVAARNPGTTAAPVYAPSRTFSDEPERAPLGKLGRVGAFTAAGGAAFLVGGVLVGFGADETQQEIQSEPHPRNDLETLQSRGQRQLRAANSMMIIGGVALAGGVSLLIVDRLGSNDSDLALGTDGRSVWLRGNF
jgi:hypothetical protein